MKKIAVSLLLILALNLSLSQAALAETLQAGIEHSDYLPSVSNTYVPGYSHGGYSQGQSNGNYRGGYQLETSQSDPTHSNLYQQSASMQRPQPQQPVIEWFQIPKVMAGSWSKRGDITVDVTDLRTGMKRASGAWMDNEMVVHMGHQLDKAGNVWHVNILPSEKDSVSNGKQVKFLTVQQICEQSTPVNLSTRTHYVITETYPTGQVADMFQQESLNHYFLVSAGEMENRSSNRVFTSSGQPVRDGTLESKFTRIGPFTPVPQMNGVDLQQALNQFLLSKGRADLAQ
jgi:hypothetical protein